jgi:hypothetical protein
VRSLQALTLNRFDFYDGNDQDSFSFVRQCTNLTSLDVSISRTVKVWNELLWRFLPNLKVVKEAAYLNPSNELQAEPISRTTVSKGALEGFEVPMGKERDAIEANCIFALISPPMYPMESIFSRIVFFRMEKSAFAISSSAMTAFRYVLQYCYALQHLLFPIELFAPSDSMLPLFVVVVFFFALFFPY